MVTTKPLTLIFLGRFFILILWIFCYRILVHNIYNRKAFLSFPNKNDNKKKSKKHQKSPRGNCGKQL